MDLHADLSNRPMWFNLNRAGYSDPPILGIDVFTRYRIDSKLQIDHQINLAKKKREIIKLQLTQIRFVWHALNDSPELFSSPLLLE